MHECKQEEAIKSLAISVATLVERVEIPIKAIDKHINHGHVWRVTIAGLIISFIINVLIFSHIYGKLTERVDTNTVHIKELIKINERIAVMEEKIGWVEDQILEMRCDIKEVRNGV